MLVLQVLIVVVVFIVGTYLFKLMNVSEKTKLLLSILFLLLVFILTLTLKMVSYLFSLLIFVIIVSLILRYRRF